jgi:chromosome partitioning protein
MPCVIGAVNLKGGVGKTSSVLHLGGTLALAGRRVLTVDNDPQSSLTAGFLGAQAARALDPASTIAAVYAGDDPYPEQVIRSTGFPGLDLLPGSRHAAEANVPAPHKAPFEEQARLRDFLRGLDGYDLVLIDNPPNLHLCSWSAMAASDHLLVPVQPEDFGAQGTQDVLESAEGVRAVINPGLAPAWFLVSMYQARRTVHQVFVEHLRGAHGADVLDAMIPESVDFIEAVTARKPVALHKPRGAAAKAVKAVAEELLARLAAPGYGRSMTGGAGEAA